MKVWRITWHDYVTPARNNLAIIKCPTLAEALDTLARDLLKNSGMKLNAWCPVKVEEQDTP